jgi:hypothetical protein
MFRGFIPSLLLSALLGAAVTLAAGVASADETDAERLFREARKLMVEERFAEACPKLRESNQLEPHVGTLLNLAACDERVGKVATAWVEYQKALTTAHAEGQVDRENLARQRLEVLEPRVPWLVLSVPRDRRDATVTLDGSVIAPAAWGKDMPVDPGSHVAAATAEGRGRWEQAFELREGERKEIEASMPVLAEPVTEHPKEARIAPLPATPAPQATTLLEAPPGFHVERRVRRGLTIGGASLFLTTYALSALTAGIITSADSGCSGSDCRGLMWTLFIPGLGPFAAMATQGNSAYGNVALAADAIAQGAGIAMFIAGLTAKHDVLVENDTHRTGVELTVAPIVGAGRSGLSLVGRF